MGKLSDAEADDQKNNSKERVMIQLGFANWLDAPDSIDIGVGSRVFNLYLLTDKRISNNFSFAFGLGIGAQNIHTEALMGEDSARNTVLAAIPGNISYKKNKPRPLKDFLTA